MIREFKIIAIMIQEDLIKRITIDPEICHGKPVIRGLRYPVESILEYLAGGDSPAEIVAEFPDLELEDIFACLAYAATALKAKSIYITPFAA